MIEDSQIVVTSEAVVMAGTAAVVMTMVVDTEGVIEEEVETSEEDLEAEVVVDFAEDEMMTEADIVEVVIEVDIEMAWVLQNVVVEILVCEADMMVVDLTILRMIEGVEGLLIDLKTLTT